MTRGVSTVFPKCFLVTTRSWATQLRPQLCDVVKVADIALTWFAPNDPSRYAPDVFPAFLRDQDGVHMFGVPTLDSYSVKVVSHTAADTQYESVDDVPDTVSRAAIEEISRNATTILRISHPNRSNWTLSRVSWGDLTVEEVPEHLFEDAGRILIRHEDGQGLSAGNQR